MEKNIVLMALSKHLETMGSSGTNTSIDPPGWSKCGETLLLLLVRGGTSNLFK